MRLGWDINSWPLAQSLLGWFHCLLTLEHVLVHSDVKHYFDKIYYLEPCELVYGILSELYFDINYNVTVNHIQKIMGSLAPISLYLFSTYVFYINLDVFRKEFCSKAEVFYLKSRKWVIIKLEAKAFVDFIKKKKIGKIISKFYHFSSLVYILYSSLITCGFTLLEKYILEGNKSSSYLLLYEDKVSLFSLYRSLRPDVLYSDIFISI